MSIQSVRERLINRLNEGDSGDRGWFVITRVHVAVSWLKGIAEYLENLGGGDVIRLTRQDFKRLATIIETDRDDPGVQIRRHHLLVMDKPLQLLQRVNSRNWDEILLTERGHELAHTSDPSAVLEQSLYSIRFAVEPWTPPTRVQQYSDFDVHVYEVMKKILQCCDGYIDRDEFDFFVSRIRNNTEVAGAINLITDYRKLAPEEKDTLHHEVRNRIGTRKAYSNWRDVGLHTFSLFSLGTSMVREGRCLLLTADWVSSYDISASLPAVLAVPEAPVRQLRMPEPAELENLLAPPAAPASNAGADAESFVAKVLRSQGWEVAFYTNRRGYGFDLWARRENQAMVIEVKSSLGALGAVSLTLTEHQAAHEYGDGYVLALVEDMDSDSPRLHMIQNPVAVLQIRKSTSASYVIPRAEWFQAASSNA
jgi:hypothetical protein